MINFSHLYSFFLFRIYNYTNDFFSSKEKLPLNVEGMTRIMSHLDDDKIYDLAEAPPVRSTGDCGVSYRAPQYDNTFINYIERYGFCDFVQV